ncbi:hypothetical protein ABMA27_015530 [Loxostege sticticalis]|uniref:TIL domain-containing protein n=1 Tax=Loxostege sticticalis TaxID=481309 RepID=A0ABR3I827_LOXSC
MAHPIIFAICGFFLLLGITCNLVCGPNEIELNCPASCETDYCPKKDKQLQSCPQPDPCPPPACKCQFNYRRADNGTCIPTEQCPPFNCSRPNEVYTPCPPVCPDDCTHATWDGQCPLTFGFIGMALPCTPQCRCQRQHWRKNGTCVFFADCKKNNPKAYINHYLYLLIKIIKCITIPEYQLESRGISILTSMFAVNEPKYWLLRSGRGFDPSTIRTFVCMKMCVCIVIILKSLILIVLLCFINSSPECGEDEIQDNCPVDSSDDYCPKSEEEAIQARPPTPNPCPKKPACKCRFNYRYASRENKTCIPTRECPPFKCKGLNEEFNPCPPLCPTDSCSQATPDGQCPKKFGRIGIVLECEPKCRCIKNYWKLNGVCVPYAQCPQNQAPDAEDTTDTETPETRSSDQQPASQAEPDNTPQGDTTDSEYEPSHSSIKAIKQLGFLHNEFINGPINMRAVIVVACLVVVCSAQKSDTLRCGLHEVASCVKPCPSEKTCRTRFLEERCAYDERPCTPKCICAEGYYRNAIGDCITEEECDKCQKPNEFYSCNSACDNECSDLTQNRTNCPIVNIKCNEWCYCDDGYARDAQRNCVPVSQCHGMCGPNEYFTCRLPCPPETCVSLVARFRCDEKQVCKPQCACKPGFLRLREGSPCIPICECPEMANSPDCRNRQFRPLF